MMDPYSLQGTLLLGGFGVFIGVLGSALGIGGGVFTVPMLVLALGLPMHQAVGVSLVAIAAASSAVASVNVERGLTNLRLGIVFETTMALGSVFSALIASRLPPGVLRTVFALALLPISFSMFLRGRKAMRAGTPPDLLPAGPASSFDSEFFDHSMNGRRSYSVKNVIPASFLSFFGGGLSGLLGLGGGVVQVPVMTMLCGVPMKAAAATSNFMIGVSAAASAFVYYRRGHIPADICGVIVVGVLIGSFAGMSLLYKTRSERLQMVFAAAMLVISVKMLIW
ncbi:MAG: sulfite exporter TauE/SafE family protein [Elusimicrobiales bacterium]|nr:sulfite exporter TauE/SafE family protein [Elusimicrobiales bacterium]